MSLSSTLTLVHKAMISVFFLGLGLALATMFFRAKKAVFLSVSAVPLCCD